MRCKIKAPDRATFDKLLTLLEKTQRALAADSGRLVISTDITATSTILDILEAGASLRKEYQYDRNRP